MSEIQVGDRVRILKAIMYTGFLGTVLSREDSAPIGWPTATFEVSLDTGRTSPLVLRFTEHQLERLSVLELMAEASDIRAS